MTVPVRPMPPQQWTYTPPRRSAVVDRCRHRRRSACVVDDAEVGDRERDVAQVEPPGRCGVGDELARTGRAGRPGVVRSTNVRMPASTSRSTLWRARAGSVWPGYSPASSRPGSTHQAWTNSSCGHASSTVAAAGGEQPAGERRDPVAGDDLLAPRAAGSPTRPTGRRRAGRRSPPWCRRRRRGWRRAARRRGSRRRRRPPRARLRARRRSSRCRGSLGGSLSSPRAGGDVGDRRVEVAPPPERRRDDLVEGRRRRSARATIAPISRQASTGRPPDGSCGSTRRSARPPSAGSRVPADRHGGEAHQRAVGGRLLVGRAGRRRRRSAGSVELVAGGDADVEAAPVRRQVPVVLPQHVAAELVVEVERRRCRGSTRPGTAPSRCRRSTRPACRPNGPPPTMSVIGSNVPGRSELERRADGVAAREAEQCADGSVERGHRVSMVVRTSCP